MSPSKTDAKGDEKYPGVAIDIADNDKTEPETIKENVATLGYNPRNDEP